ncbi:hypothetical protein C8R43DRAFT_942389 [Mycena crocata]|nr:hypothetical protein C8R43DRAFT_942389 [Mycena crocata]
MHNQTTAPAGHRVSAALATVQISWGMMMDADTHRGHSERFAFVFYLFRSSRRVLRAKNFVLSLEGWQEMLPEIRGGWRAECSKTDTSSAATSTSVEERAEFQN